VSRVGLPNPRRLAIVAPMSRPKVTAVQFIDFLIATPHQATAAEAQRTQPVSDKPAAHDAYTRLLHRLEPDSDTLWAEVRVDVRRTAGVLVLDDSVLDKPYARKMELVHHSWSGKHHRVVKGIDLITLLWTDGERHLPCDYRLYDKPNDGKTKNDHFADLLQAAKDRGFAPECVLFDGWYSSLANLKRLQTLGWPWLTRLKENRRVNPDRTGLRAVRDCAIAAAGTVVHLEGYGLVKVFRIVAKDGATEHWATSDLQMDEFARVRLADASWRIEAYHRGLKQVTNVERCQCRKAAAQRGHIGLAVRAFVVVERWCWWSGVAWFSAKWQIVRDAVRAYRACPLYRMATTATA
jgi:putative transposase